MGEAPAQQRRRVRNGIFGLAAVCLAVLAGLRFWGADPVILRIGAIASALLVVSLFMTYRAMTTALDAGLAVERGANQTDPTHDASSRALPPRPE